MARFIFRAFLFLFLAGLNGAAFADNDIPGSKDHPMFSRMPGFVIAEYSSSDFDSHEFTVSKKDEWEQVLVEGKKTSIYYNLPEGAKQPSGLQIIRNYENAAKHLGGVKLFESTDPGNRVLAMKIAKSGREVWVSVETGEPAFAYSLNIVEKGEMTQEITASDIFNELNKSGHVALYINFDTGKATVKPESAPIISQVAEMMKSATELSISVEGHTDNVGDAAKNKKLSEERAKAVVGALVKQGVDAKRLRSAGWGMEKPIASNSDEAGRAKNRRVELVKVK